MNEIAEVIRASLENRGDIIGMYSLDCTKWKRRFFTCSNCPYELGCRKLSDLLILSLKDAVRTEIVDNIFRAESLEELLTAEQDCSDFKQTDEYISSTFKEKKGWGV